VIDVGRRVGPYEVVSRLNRGGMATLFLGRQTGPGGFARHAAIKVVHDDLAADDQFVRMFMDEARLCSRIQHPNVVHVEAFGELDGQHYLVMEYIEGVSLSELLVSLIQRRETLGVEVAVGIAAQVADALHGAHETTDEDGRPLGIIHRDVSPQNVLITAGGYVKLIDFGVAKAEGRMQRTLGDTVRGKLAYMSPEQARGEPVDRRTDVFAVGVVLWESLTLRRLFRGRSDFDTMQRVRAAEVPAPSEFRADLPEPLEAVVLSALARTPLGRPPTAMQLRRELLRAVPEAVFLDPGELSDLVQRAAKSELDRRRAVLFTGELDDTVVSDVAVEPPAPASQPLWSPKRRPSGDLPALAEREATARDEGDPVALARAVGNHAVALIYAGQIDRAAAKLDEAERLVSTRALGLRAYLAAWRAQLASARGDFGARLEAQREAVKLCEEAGDPVRATKAAVNLADCFNQLGEHARAERELVEAIARTRQLGMRLFEGYGLLNLARARGTLGRTDAALADLDAAAAIGEALDDSRLQLYAQVYRAKILRRAGEPDRARTIADEAAARATELGVPGVRVAAAIVAIEATLELDEPSAAVERAEAAEREYRALGALEEGEAELYLALARAHEATGAPARAERLRAEGTARLRAVAERIRDDGVRKRYLDEAARATLLQARSPDDRGD